MNPNNSEGYLDFSPFISVLPIAVFVANKDGNIVFCNEECLDSIGPIKDIIGETGDFATKGAENDMAAFFRRVIAGQQPDDATVAVVHPLTKKKNYYKLTARPFLGQYMVFSATDQTEKVEIEQLIEEKKKQFYSIINSLGDLVFKLDREGRVRRIWSEDLSGAIQAFGLAEGKLITESFPESIAHIVLQTVREASAVKAPHRMESHYTYEGTERCLAINISPLKGSHTESIEEFLVIVKDTTEERRKQQQNEYKNRLINQLTSIEDGPLLHVIDGDPPTYTFISGNLSALTGYSEHELSTKNWFELIDEQDREHVLHSLKELATTPMLSLKDLVYRIRGKGGSIKWINNHVSKTETETGLQMVGVMLNVTEIHSLHDKLKQRERILTNTSQVAMIGGWEYDFKNDQFHLTDELYKIHERDPADFDVLESPSYYVEDHQPIIRKYLQELIEEGKDYDDELQLVTGKGNVKWIRAVGNAEWHNGRITHIYGIIQDIDEKKKQDLVLKENEKRFNAAFELAPLGIGLLSGDGRWLRVNKSLADFFEIPENQLNEIPIHRLKLVDDLGKPFDWDDVLQNHGTSHQWEEKYLTGNGRTKWGRFSINAVTDEAGSQSYFILQVVDITESKVYEENLIIARKEAEEANRIKSEFLSTMTHEIRTPLSGVIGITNLLLEEIEDREHLEQLKALKFSSDSLLLLVNDILDFSKIKSGVLSLESKPFDLRQVVEAIEELNLPRAKEKSNRIRIDYASDLATQYMGDELRIGQILNNLVNNAVKFTQNGSIEIAIKKIAEKESEHQLLFAIKDTGIGIPEDKQSSIFEQFTQADPSISRRYGGTGLGLSIAKGLTEAMGGNIYLNSKPGQGTVISFDLPLAIPSTTGNCSDLNQRETRDLQGKTILLVEDNPVSMLVSAEHLRKWNGRVIQATDGQKAVELFVANKDQIDLVLMDINIPLLNGFEAAEHIKKVNAAVPIIAVTASLEESEQPHRAIQTYLIKPFDIHDFYRTVKKHLELDLP